MNRFESPIVPSVGRVVLVRGTAVIPGEPTRELPAIVTRVHSQNTINVQVQGDACPNFPLTSVVFDGQGPEEDPKAYVSWRWMPYQVQTAKAEKPWLDGDARRTGGR